MHTGKNYKLSEFLFWTRRSLFRLLLWSAVPTALYQLLDLKWLVIPWSVVALLGTATAFIVGFKNVQTYNRTWEARQIWSDIMAASRSWAMMCRDFIGDSGKAGEMIDRHLAWLTALRYQLRAHKAWEATGKSYNQEYEQFYRIPERETQLEQELLKYLAEAEQLYVLSKSNPAAQLLSLQSRSLKSYYAAGLLESARFAEMHSVLRELSGHQGRSERIKDFPYPRQYATINTLFVRLFCLLLPLALLREFNELNDHVTGVLKGHMVWLVIPFSALVSWVYTSLEQVGESTEHPFEGSANDVPISQMSRAAEIDIREMLGATDVPPALQAQHDIML